MQEIAIKTKEKNNLKSSNEKKDIGHILEKKLLISPAEEYDFLINTKLNEMPEKHGLVPENL